MPGQMRFSSHATGKLLLSCFKGCSTTSLPTLIQSWKGKRNLIPSRVGFFLGVTVILMDYVFYCGLATFTGTSRSFKMLGFRVWRMLKLCRRLQKLRTTFLLRSSEAMWIISSVPDPGTVRFVFLMKPTLSWTHSLGCRNSSYNIKVSYVDLSS